MEYLSKYENNYFLFVLDQYKTKYFGLHLKLKLEGLPNNIKIVYCSSINDNSMKEQCLSTWRKFGNTPETLTIDNQIYYFYYSKIYEKKNDNSSKDIFNGISKLTKLYDNNKSETENIEFISEQIYKKIKEYNEPNKC